MSKDKREPAEKLLRRAVQAFDCDDQNLGDLSEMERFLCDWRSINAHLSPVLRLILSLVRFGVSADQIAAALISSNQFKEFQLAPHGIDALSDTARQYLDGVLAAVRQGISDRHLGVRPRVFADARRKAA